MRNVHDQRRVSFFMVDNEVIDQYGPVIGPNGIAIYTCIVRHAGNESHSCILRIRTIAEKCSVSTSTVKRYLKVLAGDDDEQLLASADLPPLVAITGRIGEDGNRTSSQYTLLDVPKGRRDEDPGVTENRGSGHSEPGVGSQ